MAAGGGAAPPARRAGTPVGRRGAGGKNLGRQRGGGREATAVPGRSRLRFLVLEALADDAGAGLQEIAAGIAAACFGTDAAAPGARLQGGPRRELDRSIELAAANMARAGLVRLEPGGRMQVTAAGKALLDKMGGMYDWAGSADAQAPDGGTGRRKAEPAISNKLLRQLSSAYREWQDGGPEAEAPRRGSGRAAELSSGIVASIDMLGAANERTESEEIELHRKWVSLVTFAKSLFYPRNGFDVRAESDTIKIIGGGRDTGTLLKLFGMSSWRIVVRGIEIDMPMRGCVAAGKYCKGGEDLVTGEAVRDAKVWYEHADWIGIIATPNAGEELDRMEKADRGGLDSVHEYYTKYVVPTRAKARSVWAVNWPRQCEATYGDAKVKEIDRIIGDTLKKLPDLDAKRKWRNTKEFCSASRSSWVPYR